MVPKTSLFSQSDLERFWSKVDKSGSCWEWTASDTTHGYGVWWTGSRLIMAHRISYKISHGGIPDGLVIDHLCRNRKCVKPEHLEAVTNKLNILRGVGATATNARKTHCPQGHSYSSDAAFVDSEGRRRCGVCRPKPKLVHQKFRTHCIHGHPFDEQNTIVRSNGNRACRACHARRKAEYRKRKMTK